MIRFFKTIRRQYSKFRHSDSYLSGMISAAEEYGAES